MTESSALTHNEFLSARKNRTRAIRVLKAKRAQTLVSLRDPVAFYGKVIGAVLIQINEEILEMAATGAFSVNFNMDKTFGVDQWNGMPAKTVSEVFRTLGYKVEFSCSSSAYNEQMFISWRNVGL